MAKNYQIIRAEWSDDDPHVLEIAKKNGGMNPAIDICNLYSKGQPPYMGSIRVSLIENGQVAGDGVIPDCYPGDICPTRGVWVGRHGEDGSITEALNMEKGAKFPDYANPASQCWHHYEQAFDPKLPTAMTQDAMRYAATNNFKPRIYMDGDRWCALHGDNLQEGIAGFGETPNEALLAFEDECLTKGA